LFSRQEDQIVPKTPPRYFLELTEEEANAVVQALTKSRAALSDAVAHRLLRAMRERADADEAALTGRAITDDPEPLERGES
jgi:hypothetical protein